MFHKVGRWTARFPWAICLGWLLIGTVLTALAPNWDTHTQDDDVRFVPERFTSVRAHHLMARAFPQDVSACRAVFAFERLGAPLTDADFLLIDDVVRSLEQLRKDEPALKIIKVESHQDSFVGCRLISADRHCSLVQINLGNPYMAAATQAAVDRAEKRVRRVLKNVTDPPAVYATGAAGIGRDLTKAATASLDGTTWATVALVVVVLLCVYRAPLLALVPLVTIGVSVWVSLKLLALMTMLPGVHLVNISKIFAIVILYGAGTDYCLFLISRYREELEKGASLTDALAKGVGGVGLALTASAGTVMVGLGLMALAEFAKVRYAGPAIALSLGVALLASLTLTPALLKILGKMVFWPGRPPKPRPILKLVSETALTKPGFWDVVSRRVAARPVLTWAVALAVLLPFVAVGLAVHPSYRATSELSPRADSLRGLEAIQRHFTAGEVGPISVLLASSSPWDEGAGQLDIEQLSRGFALLDNVAEVRSLTQPLGWLPPDLSPSEFGNGLLSRLMTFAEPLLADIQSSVRDAAKSHYLATVEHRGKTRYVTRIDIVTHSDPFDPASALTLKQIETWLKQELPRTSFTKAPIESECFGITANARDLAELTESDRHRVNLLVLGAIFLILLALVRKPWLAAYLLVTVLTSYYAALGATALAGYFWTGHVLWAVDWRVPFFLFTILVAVGEDYNILLVSRALQESRRHGPFEGMRRALTATGGAITSCGIIMAGTFATLMVAGLNTLVQIGFALAVGVLIDTFIVRPFLVPAFCMMVYGQQSAGARFASNDMDDDMTVKDALVHVLGPAWRNAA
jgi:RND superfamily putative drug exporter